MQIQVNTANSVKGSIELTRYVESVLIETFERFGASLTRIEAYLGDENAHKSGSLDKRCLIEARLSHHQPLVASHHADNIHQAIEGATEKLLRLLDDTVEKMQEHSRARDIWQNTTVAPDDMNLH